MSAPTAEIGQTPQVIKPARIKLSAGLTSASLLFFIIGGVLFRIGNTGYYDDDDSYYGFWAGGVTCLVLAALIFIAALVAWTITVGRQRILGRSTQANNLQAAYNPVDVSKVGAVTQTHLVSPQTDFSMQSPAHLVSPSSCERVQTEYRPVQHGIPHVWTCCRQCGRDINSLYCPSCGAAA